VRAGTENTAGALSFASCIEKYAASSTLAVNTAAAAERMELLINGILDIPGARIVPASRQPVDSRFSPWIVQAAFAGFPGEVMARMLDDAGFAVSTGSACSSREKERPVLAAMGVDKATAFESIRISQGPSTTADEIAALLAALRTIVRV
jgi:cysteine desulfurase